MFHVPGVPAADTDSGGDRKAALMEPLIEVHNLRFRYEDGTPALQGVEFSLFPGETIALFGANGSGKTTFVMHLNGLLVGEGSICVCGLTLDNRNIPAIRAKVGLVFQDSETQLFMPSVLEDVAFGLLNRGMTVGEAEARAREALSTVGMSGALTRAPYHLSAGEKKRVAIAGVLAMEPEILILDEPTTSLDPPGQRALAGLLAKLPQAKILVTHDVPFAKAMCGRAVFFENGRVAAQGGVKEIVNRYQWNFCPELDHPTAETGDSPHFQTESPPASLS
jgi:cobalt/nickel transport system ATP-binding protein